MSKKNVKKKVNLVKKPDDLSKSLQKVRRELKATAMFVLVCVTEKNCYAHTIRSFKSRKDFLKAINEEEQEGFEDEGPSMQEMRDIKNYVG